MDTDNARTSEAATPATGVTIPAAEAAIPAAGATAPVTEAATPTAEAVIPGWYEDPLGEKQFGGQFRWWDGTQWTHAVAQSISVKIKEDPYMDSVLRRMDQRFSNRQPWGAPDPLHLPKRKAAVTCEPTAAGWYQDPLDKDQLRYWAGDTWSHDVAEVKELAPGQVPSVTFDTLPDETLRTAEPVFNNAQPWAAPPAQSEASTQAGPLPPVTVPQRMCAHCGARLNFDMPFCPHCGAEQPELTATELASVIVQVQQQATRIKPEDKGPKFGFSVLGFFVPIAGLILYAVWYKDRPGPALSAGKGALAGAITGAAFWIIGMIIWVLVIAAAATAAGSFS